MQIRLTFASGCYTARLISHDLRCQLLGSVQCGFRIAVYLCRRLKRWCRKGKMVDDSIPLAEVPVRINVFGNPTRIARALGLDITLPDVDRREPEYWREVHRTGWKGALRGKIADLQEDGDPDWVILQMHPYCDVRFDLEEGIVVYTCVGDIVPALDLVHTLGSHGVPLRGDDGRALVRVSQTIFGHGIPDVSAAFSAAGLLLHFERGFPLWWVFSPARWPLG